MAGFIVSYFLMRESTFRNKNTRQSKEEYHKIAFYIFLTIAYPGSLKYQNSSNCCPAVLGCKGFLP